MEQKSLFGPFPCWSVSVLRRFHSTPIAGQFSYRITSENVPCKESPIISFNMIMSFTVAIFAIETYGGLIVSWDFLTYCNFYIFYVIFDVESEAAYREGDVPPSLESWGARQECKHLSPF